MTWNQTLLTLVVGAISLSSLFSLEVKAELSNPATTHMEESSNSIWNHLRADFRIDHQPHLAGVTSQRERYLNHADDLYAVLERGRPYFYFIMEELEKRNLPAELALIPVIESAFDPYARSHKSAAGLWQIIPSTGRSFGLNQNRWYDGRHDVFASTQVALKYLQGLNKMFDGDWRLTVAAYNAGEGTIQRAIDRNRAAGKSTDFWSLRIPTETRIYVQRFFALADLIKNSEEYGIDLPYVANRPALVLIKLNQQTDLARAAEMVGISLKELYKFNPGFVNRNATTTPPNGPHHLLLPITQTTPFTQKVAHLQKTVNASTTSGKEIVPSNSAEETNSRAEMVHPVASGDTLIKIATQYDITVAELKAANSLTSINIKPGQELLIPAGVITQKSTNQIHMLPNMHTNGRRVNYRVKQGDSLNKIATQFSTSIAELLDWNTQISTPAAIQPGELVTVYLNS